MFKRKTETEKNLETALSNENWASSGTINGKIADASLYEEDFKVICSTIWKTLDPKNKQWRQIFKAPARVEYLIKNGACQFVDECRDNVYYIRGFENFSCKEGTLERGQGIRDKVAQIIELLDDDDKIRMERKKARKFKKKFASKEMSVGSAPAKPAAKPAPAPAAKPVVDNTGIALPVSGKGTFGFGFDKVQKPKKEEKPKPAPKAAPEKKKLAPTQYTASGKPAFQDYEDDDEDEEEVAPEPEPTPAPAPAPAPEMRKKKPVKKVKTEADVLFNFSGVSETAEEGSTSMFDNMTPTAGPAPQPVASSPANFVQVSPQPVENKPVVIPDGPLPDNFDDFLGDDISKMTSNPTINLAPAAPANNQTSLYGGLVNLNLTPDAHVRPGTTIPSNRPSVPISAYQQPQQQQYMQQQYVQQQYMQQPQQYVQQQQYMQQQQMRGQMNNMQYGMQQPQQYGMQQQYVQQQQQYGMQQQYMQRY